MDNPAFIVAIVIGCIILLSVCYVYVKHQIIQWGGVSLAAIGMILIGMSVWKTIDISIDEDGFNAKLEQAMLDIDKAKQEVLSVKELANKTMKASLALKDSVEIFKAQQVLKAKNIYTGTVDGELNANTREALMIFQATKGLNQTGAIDAATLEALELRPVHNFPVFNKSTTNRLMPDVHNQRDR